MGSQVSSRRELPPALPGELRAFLTFAEPTGQGLALLGLPPDWEKRGCGDFLSYLLPLAVHSQAAV